jgi:hypothetical protein
MLLKLIIENKIMKSHEKKKSQIYIPSSWITTLNIFVLALS